MGKCWFKPGRVVVNPVNVWFPVDNRGLPGDWDFDVVSVSQEVVKCMGGCDRCSCRKRHTIYVLASPENLLCQRCFFDWVDRMEQSLAAS